MANGEEYLTKGFINVFGSVIEANTLENLFEVAKSRGNRVTIVPTDFIERIPFVFIAPNGVAAYSVGTGKYVPGERIAIAKPLEIGSGDFYEVVEVAEFSEEDLT